MPERPARVWLWWSSGKDSAWALERLRCDPGVEVERLVTTVTPSLGRVAVHGTRIEVLEAQAAAIGLPLSTVELPDPCPNGAYEAAVAPLVATAARGGVAAMAFGDLYLSDIRDYRMSLLRGSGIEPLFPLWGLDTGQLAHRMIEAGIDARIVSLDPRRVDPGLIGYDFGPAFLERIDDTVDPCGENGEFHTCVLGAPSFSAAIDVRSGGSVERDGFWYHDLELLAS